MSEYTHFTIINGTPYDFIRGSHTSYHMDDWDSAYPNVIPSGTSARLQLSFQKPWGTDWNDDRGEQVYTLSDVPGSFKITGDRFDNAFRLGLDPTNLQSDGYTHEQSFVGWKENSELYWWIAGRSNGYILRTWWLTDQA